MGRECITYRVHMPKLRSAYFRTLLLLLPSLEDVLVGLFWLDVQLFLEGS